jgi:hypothetical protein
MEDAKTNKPNAWERSSAKVDGKNSAFIAVYGVYVLLVDPLLGGLMIGLGLLGTIVGIISMFTKIRILLLLKSIDSFGLAIIIALFTIFYVEFTGDNFTTFSLDNPVITILATLFMVYSGYDNLQKFLNYESNK